MAWRDFFSENTKIWTKEDDNDNNNKLNNNLNNNNLDNKMFQICIM